MIAQIDSLYCKKSLARTYSRLVSYSLFEGRPLTTKGRWFNKVVFASYKFALMLPQLKKVEKPVFLIGIGRSGTTILGVVMSMHRQIGFLNEPKALWYVLDPKEDVLGNYGDGHGRYRYDENDLNEEIKARAHKLYGYYLAVSGNSRVFDKQNELMYRVPLLRKLFPDVKIVSIVRNGWDVCSSIDFWSKWKGVQEGSRGREDWWGLNNRKWYNLVDQLVRENELLKDNYEEIRGFTDQRNMAAVEWILSNQEALKLMETDPDEIYLVKFEDITQNPVEVLPKLLEFCELPTDDRMMDYASKALKPVKNKEPFELSPLIKDAFNETMQKLGYKS